MLTDNLKATGELKIELFDSSGALKSSQTVENLVVTSGLSYIASRMKDATATAMTHMAIGAGTTAAALADTALGSELGRVALTSTTVTTSSIAYAATFGAGVGTGAVTEAGILNAASSGTLLCRTVFSVVNKTSSDTLAITWTVTVS
jgi:hypothetical protein